MDFLLLLDNFQNSIGYNDKGDFSFTSKTDPSTITRNMSFWSCIYWMADFKS